MIINFVSQQLFQQNFLRYGKIENFIFGTLFLKFSKKYFLCKTKYKEWD